MEISQGGRRQAIDGPFRGPSMVAIAFLAMNCTVGINFGIYGPLIKTLESEFSVGRTLASSGASALLLTMCVFSPIAGKLLQVWPIRWILITGAALSALGYASLAAAWNIELVLLIYGVLLGPGAALLGIVPTSALVSAWYVRGRGRAIGFINTPLLMFAAPTLASFILTTAGSTALYLSAAIVFACIIPLLALVIDKPEDIGQKARGADEIDTDSAAPVEQDALPTKAILTHPGMWLITLSLALMSAGAATLVTHLVPMITEKGYSLVSAAGFAGAYGVTSAASALLFGVLADRIGALRAIIVAALCQALGLTLLAMASGTVYLTASVAILGLCSSSLPVLHIAAIAWLLGRENLGRALGIGYFIKLPFLFLPASAAGYSYELTKSYTGALTFHILAAIVVVSTISLAAIRPTILRHGHGQTPIA